MATLQSLNVRHAAPTDRNRISELFAAAFQQDPVMTYIFPDPTERRSRLARFFSVVDDSDGPYGPRYVTDGGEAATLWRAPGHGHLSLREMLSQGWPWIRAAGFALGRALAFSAASDANHPAEPHWYLHVAGCSPSMQGNGYGAVAIKAGLSRADAEGYPCYLETANAANLPLYQRLGFAVTKQWRVPNGPMHWSMFRAARMDSLTCGSPS